MSDKLSIFKRRLETMGRLFVKKRPVVLIILAGCVLTLPIILWGAPFQSDDGLAHARWYIHFSEQLWSGDLYPRWLVGMNNGLGSPVFFYYPPVPYFLTSFIHPLFPDDSHGWYQLGVSASLAMILSGVTARLWLRQIVKDTPALIAALLYMAGPYHLAADVYLRFSFAEFWSFVWMPLILFFTHKILDGNRLASVGFSVSYALLIMTHLPTTLIFSVVPLGYAFTLKSDQKLKAVGKIIGSMAFGVGLSAIYFYPAMTIEKYVYLDRMGTGYFSYENWLFFSNFSLWTDDKLLILLLVFDLLAISSCAFFMSRKILDKTGRKVGLFWFVMAIGSAFMMTQLSKPIWMVFYPLQKIQFPFRFNIILTLAATALIAFAVSAIRDIIRSTNFIAKTACFLLVASWIPTTVWAVITDYPLSPADQKAMVVEVEQSRDAPEYRPRGSESMNAIDWESSMDIDNWDSKMKAEYDGLMQRSGVTKNGYSRVELVKGTGQVDVLQWKPRELVLHARNNSEVDIIVNQFYFPNWTARVDGEQRNSIIQPSLPDGLIALKIPAGDHQVTLSLEKGGEELTGQIISTISLLFLLIYVLSAGIINLRDRKMRP